MSPAVVAAGAVVWKIVDGKVRVLLVHRTQHKDVTIPKGKVDPGETLPQTAVREIAEETGFDVELGAPLGTVEYRLPNGRQKVVHYWSAEVDPGAAERHSYEANGEIFALEWLPLAKAAKHLTYPHDAEVLDRFAAQVEAGAARTFSLIVLRHGKAMPHEQWDGPDRTRPLLHHGLEQSVSVAGGIAAYGPEKLLSSSAVRCLSTIGPTAALTGLDIKASESISQDAYASDGSRVEAVVTKRLAKGLTAVLCSHGPVIPQIIGAAASLGGVAIDGALRRSAALATGEFTVMHFAPGEAGPRLVAVETHAPAVA
ncbi:NUDIX domain-containing protein [Microcella daejeonensis]|uniref:NUDIX hydrolase n=1 Tax=Microcella daejeonensis TaxID=2994971 RepID=UPI00226DF293|nr:NUDIX domain-containing protein [Microcella daejeonensis]WAB84138.1 NUDIX domain-containing protein [Microcella daejeonensis]